MPATKANPVFALAAFALVALCTPGGDAQTSARGTASTKAAPVQTMSPQDRSALNTALADYDAGRLAAAQPTLATLAARYPGNFTVQAAAGMATLEGGDLAGGTPYLERAHRLNPADAGVTENLGIALLHQHRAAEALPLLQQARHQQPVDAAAASGEAEALMALHRPAEAADAFAAAARLAGSAGPTDELRRDWAVALLAAGQPAKAVGVVQAQADVATSASTQELLGEAEEKLGHYEAAFTHLKRAAELDASEANLLAYGNELLQHWTFPAAIDIFRYGHTHFPASERLYTGLGVAYFGNNDFSHAAEVFQAELAAHPEDAGIADLLGRSCSAAVSAEVSGCGDLIQFAAAHPDNVSAGLYAAIALLHDTGDPANTDKAEVLLQRTLKADPKLPEAWYQLAVVQQQKSQWAESATSLERAVALRPAYAEAHYRLARAYGHLGRKDEAQQQIALQQQSAQAAKDADTRRMQEVMTFLTAAK